MLTSALLSFAMLSFGTQEPPKTEPKLTMKTYQFVFLKTGPSKESMSAEAAQKRQREHLAGLEKMWLADSKAVLLGPLMDNSDFRGIVVLDTTPEEARALMAADPYVMAGQMVAEIRPLLAADGILRKPPKFMDLAPYTLGFYRRPAAAKNLAPLDPEESKRLQAAHLANNDRMWKSGALVWAGPFLDNTDLRGLLVFRETDQAKIREMVAEDALVKAGRLELELHPAITSKGAFPPFEKPSGG